MKKIPVIDIFAGPGGLGEGFSNVFDSEGDRVFDIRLSIEKDAHAHETLELRSFTRQFPKGKLPDEYYRMVQADNIKDRAGLKEKLYKAYPDEYEHAQHEAWLCELGNKKFPDSQVDRKIKKALNGEKDWVLIGGPPCQAYSLVGRSRVGGIHEGDHRVHLYKQYLRIIAVHQPAVFVMENVKGLLSASLNGEKIFNLIKRDLSSPSQVDAHKNTNCPDYKIYSLVKTADRDFEGNPVYSHDRDYLIQSEKYGVPQKRHRVILLGVREDLDVIPDILPTVEKETTVKDVLHDLPKLRSSISRRVKEVKYIKQDDGTTKKRRIYETIEDGSERWKKEVDAFREDIVTWNGFDVDVYKEQIEPSPIGNGSEFVACELPAKEGDIHKWYKDERLGGLPNHESRSHLLEDLKRYLFSSMFTNAKGHFPKLHEYVDHAEDLLPDHDNAKSGKFNDRFRVQLPNKPATTVTSHISKDGHYFIHYDYTQCRSFTVREAARIQTFPDNYLFCGSRTAQFHQVGNAVPPYLAKQIGEVVKTII